VIQAADDMESRKRSRYQKNYERTNSRQKTVLDSGTNSVTADFGKTVTRGEKVEMMKESDMKDVTGGPFADPVSNTLPINAVNTLPINGQGQSDDRDDDHKYDDHNDDPKYDMNHEEGTHGEGDGFGRGNGEDVNEAEGFSLKGNNGISHNGISHHGISHNGLNGVSNGVSIGISEEEKIPQQFNPFEVADGFQVADQKKYLPFEVDENDFNEDEINPQNYNSRNAPIGHTKSSRKLNNYNDIKKPQLTHRGATDDKMADQYLNDGESPINRLGIQINGINQINGNQINGNQINKNDNHLTKNDRSAGARHYRPTQHRTMTQDHVFAYQGDWAEEALNHDKESSSGGDSELRGLNMGLHTGLHTGLKTFNNPQMSSNQKLNFDRNQIHNQILLSQTVSETEHNRNTQHNGMVNGNTQRTSQHTTYDMINSRQPSNGQGQKRGQPTTRQYSNKKIRHMASGGNLNMVPAHESKYSIIFHSD
jgi:hypothetical protein